MLAFLFRSLVINFPFIHWIKTLYKCLTFPFFIPFKKGIKTLHKSLVFLLKDAFKIFLLSKELKPFIKVTISLYRIPFIKGIEILYKGLAFPQKFVNFYSVMHFTFNSGQNTFRRKWLWRTSMSTKWFHHMQSTMYSPALYLMTKM